MPRPKKSLSNIPTKVLRRKKPINLEHLKTIEPLTENQEKIWEAYGKGQNLVLHGAAGTGKTFISLYQIPYKNMVKYMFEMPDDNSFEALYSNLRAQETISFWSTSFIRGTTFDNSIILVDEFSNLNFHELDSIITRVGEDCKIIFCGDYFQSDLTKSNEREGILDFLRILKQMPSFTCVEFGIDDIVRSGLVKEYLVSKLSLGY